MQKIFLAIALATALPAHAGGLVVIEEAAEAAPAPKLKPFEKAALVAGVLLLIGIAASGGSDNCNGETPEPTPEPC